MKISIPKKVYELDFDGTVVTIRRPTIAEQEKFMDDYDNAKSGREKEEVMLNLLVTVGFEKDFLKTLDIGQLEQVRDLVTMGEIKKK